MSRRYGWLVLAAVGIACAHPTQLDSRWPSPEITVDGAYPEWSGHLVRIDNERSVALGIANDRQNLYLCLVTRDLDVQTLIERVGFTLWFDPEGGAKRQLGFRVAPFQAGTSATAPAYIEIVQHGAEYGEQLAGSSTGPIDVEGAAHADVIAYEIRIALGTPLSGASGLSGVTLAPGERLGIGFETEPLTSRRRTRVQGSQEPEPSPAPGPQQPGAGDPRYEQEDPSRGMRHGRKIAPLRAWVVAVLARGEAGSH